MNFKKFLLVVSVVLASIGTAEAQQSKSDLSVEFRPNWSVQLQGGAAYTRGEAKFGKLISPAAALNFQWQFHHAFGLRLGLGLDFRLSDVVSLGLEGNTMIFDDTFNSKAQSDSKADWHFMIYCVMKMTQI